MRTMRSIDETKSFLNSKPSESRRKRTTRDCSDYKCGGEQCKIWIVKRLLPFLVLILYALLGALAFVYLEDGTYDASAFNQTVKLREEFENSVRLQLLQRLRKIDESGSSTNMKNLLRLNVTVWYEEEHKNYVNKVLNYRREGPWSPLTALTFSISLFSTIGHGKLTPKTRWGQLFAIGYAVIGIPLFIYVLNELGKLFYLFLNYLWAKVCCCQCCCKHCASKKSTKLQPEYSVPFAFVLTLLVIWILFIATIFILFAGHCNVMHAVYYAVMSITTVGSGELLPKQIDQHLVCLILVIMGLCFISALVRVVVASLEQSFVKTLDAIEYRYLRSHLGGQDLEMEMLGTHFGLKDIRKQLSPCDKIWLWFIPDHMQEQLQQKYTERSRMRDLWTQTGNVIGQVKRRKMNGRVKFQGLQADSIDELVELEDNPEFGEEKEDFWDAESYQTAFSSIPSTTNLPGMIQSQNGKFTVHGSLVQL